MSNPLERIQTDLKTALKAKEKERLGVLRMLLTELKNEQIKHGREIDDENFLATVRRLVKQRKDSATQYRQGNRPELAEKEEREIEVLVGYLPQQVSDDEIRRAIVDLVAAEELSGPKAIGVVMRAMIARFGATAEGGTINRLAREVLGL